MDFEKYSKEVEEATNNINLKLSSNTKRKGKSKLRDRLVFYKYAWQESLSFMSVLQSIVIFMALIPASIVSVNEFFIWMNIPFVFPVHISSLFAIIFIIFVFVFGLVAVRYIGTISSSNEIGTKMNPGNYMLWEKLQEIEKTLENLKEEKQNEKRKENIGYR